MGKWLLTFEAIAVILFLGLMFLYADGVGTQVNPPPLAQAQKFIEQGDADFAKQDLVRALVAYWRAIECMESTEQGVSDQRNQLDKSLLHAHLRVAEIYFHSNWNEDAEAHLERVAKLKPDHIDVHLLRGKLLYGFGEKEAATEEFLHVLDIDPAHPEAHYTLGLLYQGSKQHKEAINYHKQAIKNDIALVELPFETAPIGLLARLQLSRTYRRIVQEYTYGDHHLTNEQLTEMGVLTDKAIAILKEAVAHKPNYTEAKDDLIDLLYLQAQGLERGEGDVRFYGEALKVYEQIVKLDPNQIDAWQNMGEINLSFLHNREAALNAFQSAFALYPDPNLRAVIKSIEEDLQIPMPD